MRGRLSILLWLCAQAPGSPAAADEPPLHEYVPDVAPDEALVAISEQRGGPGAELLYEGELLEPPALDPPRADEPAAVALADDGVGSQLPGRRAPSFRPDRKTELEGTLSYYSSFNPTIAPFKRMTALDTVALGDDGRTPVLTVAAGTRARVFVEGADSEPPDARPRDRFWGNVVADFSHGAVVPLPSVSPESRILSLRSVPPLDLRVQRDSADNFFVSLPDAEDAPEVERIRITFLTDAPRSYFGTTIPQLASTVLASEVTPLPDRLQEQAEAFARELGLERGSDLRVVLHALTRHFRSFEESSTPPDDSGNIYADLVRAQKGVCRHRAYGFTITARALGIPTRFVQNEAHAWVEVKLPGMGWMRIDLGGAAHGLRAHGASERPVYRPAQPDSLPRPDAYERSYSRLSSERTSGLRPPDRSSLVGRWLTPSPDSPRVGGPAPGPRSEPGPAGEGVADTASSDDRESLEVLVDRSQMTVSRGRKLRVTGRVVDERGRGVPGLRIEVSLAQDPTRSLLLGITATGEQGSYRGAFGIPPDLAAGDYALIVVTPGSEQYRPAIAR